MQLISRYRSFRKNHTENGSAGYSLLLIVIILLFSFRTYSQEQVSCSEKLRDAMLLFDQGNTEKIPSLLSKCLRSGFNNEEEMAAYKLMIQVLLLDNRVVEADSMMLEFLARNPEYRLSASDHSGFSYIYNRFEVIPALQVALHAGSAIPFLTFVEENLTAGEPGESGYNTDAGNLMVSAEVRLWLNSRLELSAEAGYSRLRFSNSVDFLNFGRISYSEIQNRLEIPVAVIFNLKPSGRFTPYLKAGAGVAVNFRTTADVSLVMTDNNNAGDRTGETLVRTDSRTPADIFLQPGAGVKYKIPGGFLFAEIRSDIGLLQQNKRGGETVDELEYYYLWSDPGFRINSIGLNVGYIRIFYKPVRKGE